MGDIGVYCQLDATGTPVLHAETLEQVIASPENKPRILDALTGALPLAPCEPSKIVCVGLNYRRHAEEMSKPIPEEPLIFLKPTTAILPPNGTIRLPASSSEVHHEGELAIVIGKSACEVPATEAWEYVAGLTIMNDVTARDIQRREGKYTRGKGFDTFAPLGPTLVMGVDPNELQLTVRVNGEVKQSSGCDDMIFSVPEIIEFISSVMTLLPGDVISTGTPAGVGPLLDGDLVEVEISQIGILRNQVATR